MNREERKRIEIAQEREELALSPERRAARKKAAVKRKAALSDSIGRGLSYRAALARALGTRLDATERRGS